MTRTRLGILIICVLAVTFFAGCSKNNSPGEDLLLGTWIREGTNGTGPGNKLHFSRIEGAYRLSFDCSGSPGPDWPDHANTEYRLDDGKLSYLNYADSNMGYYTAGHFQWIDKGAGFEVWFNEILLFMSSTYPVRYIKQ